MAASFEALITQASNALIAGWDFSWLEGRATEERPPWGYAGLAAQAARGAASLLDLATGGGEMLAALPDLPARSVATEGWEPNLARAHARLRSRRTWVVGAQDDALPFGDATFDLVLSRHPVLTRWDEVARVLAPGGRYLSQQIGPRSMSELSEFLMGPQSGPPRRTPEAAADGVVSAGLRVERIESARLRASFFDVGAVVYFLRLVVWTVPDFTVERYRDRLAALHEHIEAHGAFAAHASRFLIEATKAL